MYSYRKKNYKEKYLQWDNGIEKFWELKVDAEAKDKQIAGSFFFCWIIITLVICKTLNPI